MAVSNYMLQSSTAQLVLLDGQRPKSASGAGVVVTNGVRRYLLTAEHVGREDGVALQLGSRGPDIKTGVYRLGDVRGYKLKATGEKIDLAYFQLPDDLECCRHFAEPILSADVTRFKPCTMPLKVFDLKTIPLFDAHGEYAFCGCVDPDSYRISSTQERYLLTLVIQYHRHLTFILEDGFDLYFKLDTKHRVESRDLSGCSGAPILDQNGNLVALVSQGDVEAQVVKAVNLIKLAKQLIYSFAHDEE